MSILLMIILVSVAGGVLSVLAAAFFALKAKAAWVPMLISYAIGALLGAVFLEILPHAFQISSSLEVMSATVLLGILLFFMLEKLVLWRHCHGESCEVHTADARHHGGHDHGRSGLMIMIGDTFHNFVDGVLIAAAFLVDVRLGFVTAVAIIAHEIPQEVGDFLILLHSGYSKQQALLFNLVSSMATLVGAVGAYFALGLVQGWIPTILGLAAASMIYVAVADLIPGLHKRTELRATLQQVGLIGLGVASIWLAGELVH
ncbi:ZIP family metal transporter [Methylobacillus flagellatus]|uniref:ZIP family metal transporter n=1 Tax=Methylobacillus flagellatus TaxID=405 RepID=UPI002853FB8F|nr:ZIP family metal transporter [Methylobacillus flagellatus]MDR5171545.1 ZIP family metal transporter [Methylobacillus flagellatus]